MASVKSRTKGKRVLPNIPGSESAKTFGRAVTFNSETIETSIGGTQTPGKVKGDPLSPVNQLSYEETSLRSGNSDLFDDSVNESLQNECLNIHSYTGTTPIKFSAMESKNPPNLNGSVSVEIEVTRETSNCESDKENEPGSPRGSLGVTVDKTPLQGSQLNKQSVGSCSTEKELDAVRLYSPSPNMKFFHNGTPARRHTLDEKLLGTPECYNVVQLDRHRFDLGYGDNGDDEGDGSSVTVAVRVRPYSQRELSDPNVKRVVSMYGNETVVRTDGGSVHSFLYDFSFSSFDRNDPEYASQERVYGVLAQPLLGKAFEGYNTCLFAYGQTGSGKSYSIMGHGEDIGIIPRFCEELFSRADHAKDFEQVKIHVEISFFEIYNEKIHDLLASSNKGKGSKKTTLRVREHPTLGPYVEGLSTFVVNSFEDVEGWITLGNKNRATAATGMNDKSSRSHSVFTIVLTQTKTEILEGQEHDHAITSKINLVDLAGSERQSQAQTSGERLREGANINKSLMTLGKVISQLAEQSSRVGKRKKKFIPYRDSVLTWLLKESLGGNSKTAMIATISPANHHTEETLSTLRYAQTARSIVNIARVNEDPKAKLIRDLRAEIERLRSFGLSGNEDATRREDMLREKLLEKEREMEEITRSWQERLRQSEERKQEEAKLLEKAGVTLKVDNRLPNLVNLNEDPQLSEMLLYNIKEGTTKVGRMGSNSKHDIQLNGALIADNHCIITNIEAVITITPIGDAPTYVNGNLISEPVILKHGDRVILGGDHYFRFNHPMEVQKNRKDKPAGVNGVNLEIKDFQYAKNELMMVQEARLQEARLKAQEMLMEVERTKKDAELKLADMEKVMREESEEKVKKVKEAEEVINKLKRDKMMLEHEVIVGRKRQQVADAEMSMKMSDMGTLGKSPLLEMLQAHKEAAQQKLEEAKQRMNEFLARREKTKVLIGREKSPTNILEVSTGKMDLYRVELQVREANKISQYLNRHTKFQREDYLDGDEERTVIKVTNTKLNVCTHWTLGKFEERLIQMRDMYQNEAESSADDDEVFNDPKDEWEKDESMSPKLQKSGHKVSIPSPSLRQALYPGSSSQQDSEGSRVHSSTSSPGFASLCKDVVNFTLGQLNSCSLEESIPDKILHNCHSLKSCLSQAAEIPVTMETSHQGNLTRRDALQLSCIQLTSTFNGLLNNCVVLSSMYQSLQSALIQDLLNKIVEQVKVIGGQIARFLQGCEGNIESLMEEAKTRLQEGVHTMCKLTGELALATDTSMLYFEDAAVSSTDATMMVSADICQSFFNGCETFIDKTLQGALRTVEDYETKAQLLTDKNTDNMKMGVLPQNVEICVTSCKDLLNRCQTLQVEADCSMLEQSCYGPSQFCNGNYQRSQSLVSHISTLVDAVGILVQDIEPVMEGQDCDVRKVIKCAGVINKSAQKLTAVAGRDLNKLRSSTSSETDSVSILSNTQLEYLDYASQEVCQSVSSMIQSLQKMVELERTSTVTTPRGKRLLPTQPGVSPLAKNSVKNSPENGRQ